MRHDVCDMHASPSEAMPALQATRTIRREPIVLNPSMDIAEAFAAVARGCMIHITTAAEVARRSDNPEGIHQVRVGIRRLRAAFSVFGSALPRRRPAVLKQLRSLQRRLGAARELDVLLEETIASMPEKLQNRRGMRALTKAVERSRVTSRRRARAALASKRCVRLLSQLGARDRSLRATGDGRLGGARENDATDRSVGGRCAAFAPPQGAQARRSDWRSRPRRTPRIAHSHQEAALSG